jgi:hypothetical protein
MTNRARMGTQYGRGPLRASMTHEGSRLVAMDDCKECRQVYGEWGASVE